MEQNKSEGVPGRKNILEVKNLSVSYGHINALKGVDIEVKTGEIVVLIGANGAGKTSLLETILGVNDVGGGSIFFKGEDITKKSADRIDGAIITSPGFVKAE